MVDVGRNDCAATGDLFTDKFRGDDFRHAGAEAVTRVLLIQQAGGAGHFKFHVFADGDEFHLGRDDALTRVVHLRDVGPGLGAARVVDVGKAQLGQFRIGEALATEVGTQAGQTLSVATVVDPRRTHIGQAFADVDHHVRIGVGPRGIVNGNRRVDFAAEVGRGHIEGDFAHRHEDVRARALNVDFLRTGERLDRLLVDLGRVTQVDRVF
ncbi:hypothetical protein D3C87_1070320 [compost metagenome]